MCSWVDSGEPAPVGADSWCRGILLCLCSVGGVRLRVVGGEQNSNFMLDRCRLLLISCSQQSQLGVAADIFPGAVGC